MKCKYKDCNNNTPLPTKKWHKKYNKYYNCQKKECSTCSQLMWKYGITTPERDNLLIKQDNKCLCCNSAISFLGMADTASRHSAVVDHCHKHGYVRGILCGSCNLLLGKAYDSTEVLQQAINYLNQTKLT